MQLTHPSLILSLLLVAACKGEPVADDTDPGTASDTDTGTETDTQAPTPANLVIYPFQALVESGTTLQLRARSEQSDHSSQTVTSGVTWTVLSGDAQIDANGLLTATGAGDVLVSATANGFTTQAAPKVYTSGLALTGLSVAPSATTILVGQTAQFEAQATLTGELAGDLAATCTWASSDTAIATAGAAGAVTAVSPGQSTITATCGTAAPVTATLTVQAADTPLPAPDLAITEVRSAWMGGANLRYEVDLVNNGGHSSAFALDLVVDEASAPSGASSDLALWHAGLAPGQTRTLTLPATFAGARPASIASWVSVDRDGLTGDTNPANNTAGPVALDLPGDASANLRVGFYGLTVFGPGDSGVEGELFNDGPDDLTDLVLYFERDQPGTVAFGDLQPASSELTQVVPTLAAGESYYWMFEYNQAPMSPDEWYSCMYVTALGVADADLSDNFSCATVTE